MECKFSRHQTMTFYSFDVYASIRIFSSFFLARAFFMRLLWRVSGKYISKFNVALILVLYSFHYHLSIAFLSNFEHMNVTQDKCTMIYYFVRVTIVCMKCFYIRTASIDWPTIFFKLAMKFIYAHHTHTLTYMFSPMIFWFIVFNDSFLHASIKK